MKKNSPLKSKLNNTFRKNNEEIVNSEALYNSIVVDDEPYDVSLDDLKREYSREEEEPLNDNKKIDALSKENIASVNNLKSKEPYKRKKKSKLKRFLIVMACILAVLLTTAFVVIKSNPRLQMLVSIILFTETTLDDKSYIAYNIDLMELFQNYFNGDTTIEGELSFNARSLGFSSDINMEGERSLDQKKLAFNADMSILGIDVGELDFYEDQTNVYTIIPMLDNLSYSFNTENNLFLKAPELTHDIDQEWFRDNMSNIVTLMQQIDIEKTDEIYTDDDGNKSTKYIVTVPEGCGGFIWELLGIDAPDYDIVANFYIDNHFKFNKIEFDLSDVMDGVTLVVEGEKANKCVITYDLPSRESLEITFTRNPNVSYTNFVYIDAVYTTFLHKEIVCSMYCTMMQYDEYMETNLKDIKIVDGKETLLEANFTGQVNKVEKLDDVFRDVGVDLNSLDEIYWSDIRYNIQGFFQDITAEAKSRLYE